MEELINIQSIVSVIVYSIIGCIAFALSFKVLNIFPKPKIALDSKLIL